MGMTMPKDPERPARIELHIEELVLHGFPMTQRLAIGDAVERELQRLLSKHGLPVSAEKSMNVEHLYGGVLRIAKNDRPQVIGTQLAQTLHRQILTVQKADHSHRRARETQSIPGGAGRK
jgi:hypothetical protein